MRFVTFGGRAGLLVADQVFDVEQASGGRLPADPMTVLARHWDALVELDHHGATSGGQPVGAVSLGPPVPRPPSVMAAINNYPPAERTPFPMVVGKAPSSLVGPFDTVVLPDPSRLPLGAAYVIAEPELGVVTRRAARHLTPAAAVEAIAGFVVAQDITERCHEFGTAPSPWTWENLPAKTLGKSFDTFCPIGPALVTLDEFRDPADLRTRCWINDELRFDRSTRDLVMTAGELVALLSSFMTLEAGTLCLTGSSGTLDGNPPVLQPGDELRTEITGIGTLRNPCEREVDRAR